MKRKTTRKWDLEWSKMASKVKRQVENEAMIIEFEKEESLWNVRNHLYKVGMKNKAALWVDYYFFFLVHVRKYFSCICNQMYV